MSSKTLQSCTNYNNTRENKGADIDQEDPGKDVKEVKKGLDIRDGKSEGASHSNDDKRSVDLIKTMAGGQMRSTRTRTRSF